MRKLKVLIEYKQKYKEEGRAVFIAANSTEQKAVGCFQLKNWGRCHKVQYCTHAVPQCAVHILYTNCATVCTVLCTYFVHNVPFWAIQFHSAHTVSYCVNILCHAVLQFPLKTVHKTRPTNYQPTTFCKIYIFTPTKQAFIHREDIWHIALLHTSLGG